MFLFLLGPAFPNLVARCSDTMPFHLARLMLVGIHFCRHRIAVDLPSRAAGERVSQFVSSAYHSYSLVAHARMDHFESIDSGSGRV
jgi:hypothetical protein